MNARHDTPAAHLCAAVAAVMQHAIDHGLSAPWVIYPGQDAVELQVPTGTYTAWATTLNITDQQALPAGPGERFVYGGPAKRWSCEATLPATGVRVVVRGVMVTRDAAGVAS